MKQLDLLGLGFDASAWVDWVLARVRMHVAAHGEITPDDVQAMCERHGRTPPHSSHYGCLWDRLRRLGLVRTAEERTSRTPSNNARKVHVWKPGPRWSQRSADGRRG